MGHPFIICGNYEEAIKMVLEDGNNLLVQQHDNYGYYLTQRHCELFGHQDGVPLASARLMFRKRHPLLQRINKAIRRNNLTLNMIWKKYQDLALWPRRCPDKNAPKPLRK